MGLHSLKWEESPGQAAAQSPCVGASLVIELAKVDQPRSTAMGLGGDSVIIRGTQWELYPLQTQRQMRGGIRCALRQLQY